ncbi:helix-turn-helix domain-containing protein [Collinsella tanakaei]|uniref:helix-turn-helix domain-containing protein n=1 Tax=Collinsella tanakaei TaxID=626935 RepID=UPI0019585105|nr:AraC family transcriptional regulator [Collinsella tanakaei]MBM6867452.1 helix-turn-helix transcriptional regulator [Collinsella tanakaei]
MSGQLRYTYENPYANLKLEHYVYRIGSYHYNWHPDFELLMVVKGSVEMCASGSRHVLEEDDMILINPNEGHATLGLGEGNTAMVLHIDPAFFTGYFGADEFVRLDLVSNAATRNEPRFAVIRRCLAQMMVLSVRRDPASRLRYDALVYRLISAAVSVDQVPDETARAYRIDRRGKDAVSRLVAYIDGNYRERITLADLADKTGYNATYISQLFKRKLGINFSEYLLRVRLSAATAVLSSSDARVSDIAAEHGFADLKSFNAAFRKTFGKTPAEYRRQLSEDNRAGDTAFKQVFVSVDDEYVGAKLARYIVADAGVNVQDADGGDEADTWVFLQEVIEAVQGAQELLDGALARMRGER